MTNPFRGAKGVADGLNLVLWPRRPVGWWSGELCMYGPRVTSGARARWGMACGGVVSVYRLSVHFGVRRKRWDGGQSRDWISQGVMMRDRVVGPLKKGSSCTGGGGGEASPNVSHKGCSVVTRPPKGGTPEEFLDQVGGDSRVSRLHHSFQIKTRDGEALCCVVVDSGGYLLFNEATQM